MKIEMGESLLQSYKKKPATSRAKARAEELSLFDVASRREALPRSQEFDCSSAIDKTTQSFFWKIRVK